jgi:hypothetical protein
MYLNQTAPEAAAETPAAPLREAVNNGDVSLDPEAGDRLTKLLNNQLDLTEAWLERSKQMARPLPLGTSGVAEAMSDKFQFLANGDELSLYAVVRAYREVLTQTQEAVNSAIRNVQGADEDSANTFRTQVI